MKMRIIIILLMLTGFVISCHFSVAQSGNNSNDSITVLKKANPNIKTENISKNKVATWKKTKNPEYKERINNISIADADKNKFEKATTRKKRNIIKK